MATTAMAVISKEDLRILFQRIGPTFPVRHRQDWPEAYNRHR
jgi:hypothetical protein